MLLGAILVLTSAAFYFVHYLLFGDVHHIFIYLVGDIAFVPVEVLLVTLILHKLLESRDKKALLHKLNMVIGAFFSEAGTDLLKLFSGFDTSIESIREKLNVTSKWEDTEFNATLKELKQYTSRIDLDGEDLDRLKTFLLEKRRFMLGLLENPNLLEHDSFTDLLWAVFHLTEEMAHRASMENLPETDRKHLKGDIDRAYTALIAEWIDYMHHLKKNYPYLFSLGIRTNPFHPEASIIVK